MDQSTFLVWLQDDGGFCPDGATPSRVGPRHHGQSCAAIAIGSVRLESSAQWSGVGPAKTNTIQTASFMVRPRRGIFTFPLLRPQKSSDRFRQNNLRHPATHLVSFKNVVVNVGLGNQILKILSGCYYPINITSLAVDHHRLRVVIGKDLDDRGTAYDFAIGAFLKEMAQRDPPTED
jgi:hypothetical protein